LAKKINCSFQHCGGILCVRT